MSSRQAGSRSWVWMAGGVLSAIGAALSGAASLFSALGGKSNGPPLPPTVRVEVPADPRLLALAGRVDRLGDDYARARAEAIAARKAEIDAVRLAAERGGQVERLLDRLDTLTRELTEARTTLTTARQEGDRLRQRVEQFERQLAEVRSVAEASRAAPPASPRSSLLPSLAPADDRPALLRHAAFATSWARLEQLDGRYSAGEIGPQRFLEEVVAESARMLAQCDLLAADCVPDDFIRAKRLLQGLKREALSFAR